MANIVSKKESCHFSTARRDVKIIEVAGIMRWMKRIGDGEVHHQLPNVFDKSQTQGREQNNFLDSTVIKKYILSIKMCTIKNVVIIKF